MTFSLRRAPQRRNFVRGAALAEPAHIAHPVNIAGIQSEVLRCTEDGERLRVAGGGTAANALWRTDENLLTLDRFTGIESADLERNRVWVRAGTRLGELAAWLGAHDLAIPVNGWSAAATVAGAVSVGAHGSGARVGNLPAHVSAIGLVTADGVHRRISTTEQSEYFDAVRLNLGALGVVSHVELQCSLAQQLRVRRFKSALEDTLARLPELRSNTINLSFEWFPGTGATRIHTSTTAESRPRRAGVNADAREWLMRNGGHWALAHTTEKIPRLTQLAHRAALNTLPESEKIEANPQPTPQAFVRLTEYLEYQIDANRLPQALLKLEELLTLLQLKAYMAIEVGFIAADSIWLSPAYDRDTAFIRLKRHRGSNQPQIAKTFADVLTQFDARPHWGSVHHKSASDLNALYPRWNDFLAVRQALDPRGVFLNTYLSKLFGFSQA